MTTFRQLLEQFEAAAKTRAAKGRHFEEFCKAFFKTDPLWRDRFDAVWGWQEWPDRGAMADTGVDLVAREVGTGDLVAIQCKFWSPDATLGWGNVSTFVGMLAHQRFSSGLIVTTAGSESGNLQSNVDAFQKPIMVWRVQDFEDSSVDWDQFKIDKPTQLSVLEQKALRPHQTKAIDEVLAGFQHHDRGQMVMACGTGKTFTSLRLAEQMVGVGGSVLFLVPSINLLSQSVKAWAMDARIPLATFAVCSDVRAGKRRDDEDISPNDLSFPASTNAEELHREIMARRSDSSMAVVFSTYQSIDVITECQQLGIDRFDLIICDEAHRTTGAFKDDGDQSAFTKVHDDHLVWASRRVYMTATPRIYGDQAKAKAAESDVLVASMDDVATFGPVFHELGFGEAVAQKLLTDYKVLVLAVDEDSISEAFQRQLSKDGELALDDYAKIVGCWHGLSKRGPQFEGDSLPMQRAVAFSSTIKQSKQFTEAFPLVVNAALADRSDPNAVRIETDHVDGTTNVQVRSDAVAWLEEPPGQRVCRVLSNAKCLTEGVDVPALDAVLFLNPRKSIVDVVQAVGRVMRLNPGKDFGYVILPIGVPAGMRPEAALRDNKRYQVVWQVLQALRSHDERLAAEINKIDINKSSDRVSVIGIGMAGGDRSDNPGSTVERTVTVQLAIPDLREWRDALYARIVERVGDSRYMENWAADIQQIAASQESRIRALLANPDINPEAAQQFDAFHTALKHNLNDSISREDSISMLSQHLITRPVFEALFGEGDFTHKNPVSKVMQGMLDVLDEHNLSTETATLEGFYAHIRMLLGGIGSAEGRQHVINELYEKFFKKALPKTAEALGIVYTPVEVVDFINLCVNELLQEHFGASLSDEDVHILDPFTGTGTFITRLMQTGLITSDALPRKYAKELHANEYMLLAYYIAAINIEATYQSIVQADDYVPFNGIVLTDTFQMSEADDTFDTVLFPVNNDRADRQKALDIRVVIGNPPYSGGQTSQNDNNANFSYPDLDGRIASTYVAVSDGNPRSLYDSYVRAIRWASDRVQSGPSGGVIGFVTNGGWLDGKAGSGLRRVLRAEFDRVYVFNLRGNANSSGEFRRAEGGNVFGQGSKTLVTVMLLVRRPQDQRLDDHEILYRDIGDYLSESQKLAVVREARLSDDEWVSVTPNKHADWLRHRVASYDTLLPLGGETDSVFETYHRGVETGRDVWVYNFGKADLLASIKRMVRFFNSEVDRLRDEGSVQKIKLKSARVELVRRLADRSETSISWTNGAFGRLADLQPMTVESDSIRPALYRPFNKQMLAFDSQYLQQINGLDDFYPSLDADNRTISVVGSGNLVPFGVLATDTPPQLAVIGASSATPAYARWRYLAASKGDLFDVQPTKVSNIKRSVLARFGTLYGSDVDDDAVFAYVYGIMHSPDFRSTFDVNLKKEAPRIPLVVDRPLFDAFAAAGKELLDLHIRYETVDPFPLVEEWSLGAQATAEFQFVGDRKMRHPTTVVDGDRADDFSRLIFNPYLTLSGIPDAAYRYQVGTRTAIDWLVDRYYVSTDKASGIRSDPNEWGRERGEPGYIIDLIKRVVAVSVRTVEIVEALPRLAFGEDGIAHRWPSPDSPLMSPAARTPESTDDLEASYGNRERFPTLNDGWLDGYGRTIAPDRLDLARTALELLEQADRPAPTHLSATGDGAVRMEWHHDESITSIDFEADGEIDVVSSRRDTTVFSQTFGSVEEMIANLDAFGELL